MPRECKANKQAQKRRNDAMHEIKRLHKILDKQNERLEKQWDKIERSQKLLVLLTALENGGPVDITPFRMWLLRQYRQHGYNIGELAEDIGQDPSRVRRWLDGFQWNGAGRDPTRSGQSISRLLMLLAQR